MTQFTDHGRWDEQARSDFLRQAARLTVVEQGKAHDLSPATVSTYRAQFRRLAGIPSLNPRSTFNHVRRSPVEGVDYAFSTGAKNPDPREYGCKYTAESTQANTPRDQAGPFVQQTIRDLVNRLSRTEAERDAAKNQVEIVNRKLGTIRAALGE